MSGQQDFREQCRRFFNEANGGKPLTPGALCKVIRKVCPSFKGSDQDIAQIFLSIDVDEDRLITLEEFETAMNAPDAKDVTSSQLEEIFRSFDKDGSGKLNREELKLILLKNCSNVSDQTLEALIDGADLNKDGEVSYQEFLKAWEGGA